MWISFTDSTHPMMFTKSNFRHLKSQKLCALMTMFVTIHLSQICDTRSLLKLTYDGSFSVQESFSEVCHDVTSVYLKRNLMIQSSNLVYDVFHKINSFIFGLMGGKFAWIHSFISKFYCQVIVLLYMYCINIYFLLINFNFNCDFIKKCIWEFLFKKDMKYK